MREHDAEKAILEKISQTPIGETVKISCGGVPLIIEVELCFAGGWRVTQTVIPGGSLEFTRGADGYMEAMTIKFLPYDGLS